MKLLKEKHLGGKYFHFLIIYQKDTQSIPKVYQSIPKVNKTTFLRQIILLLIFKSSSKERKYLFE